MTHETLYQMILNELGIEHIDATRTANMRALLEKYTRTDMCKFCR